MKKSIVASSLLLLTAFSFILSSCDNNDDDPTPLTPVQATTFKDLYAKAAGGHYTFFSFSEGDTISLADSATTKWDIAFKNTRIIFNSGASGKGNAAVSLQTGVFDEIASVSDTVTFKQDAKDALALTASSDKGWYNYNSTSHIITPIPGKFLIIRTAEGKYAKMEILSYYKGAPATPDPLKAGETAYYTFRYVYQPNDSKELK